MRAFCCPLGFWSFGGMALCYSWYSFVSAEVAAHGNGAQRKAPLCEAYQ
jgi:hypothetical protein|tara:strand:+ start:328 stop:474 length:147 start_codon:yes stop_codon:yes gene_type:complete